MLVLQINLASTTESAKVREDRAAYVYAGDFGEEHIVKVSIIELAHTYPFNYYVMLHLGVYFIVIDILYFYYFSYYNTCYHDYNRSNYYRNNNYYNRTCR